MPNKCLYCGREQTKVCGICSKPVCEKCDYVVDATDELKNIEFCCDQCSLADPESIPPTASETAQKIVEAVESGEIEILEEGEDPELDAAIEKHFAELRELKRERDEGQCTCYEPQYGHMLGCPLYDAQ